MDIHRCELFQLIVAYTTMRINYVEQHRTGTGGGETALLLRTNRLVRECEQRVDDVTSWWFPAGSYVGGSPKETAKKNSPESIQRQGNSKESHHHATTDFFSSGTGRREFANKGNSVFVARLRSV